MPRGRAASGLRFPTIPHLFGSASDAGDVVLSPAQTRAFLSARVRVTEKYDGLNVGLLFTRRGALRVVSREHGVLRPEQLGVSLWPLVDFAYEHLEALLPLLADRFVLFGEWLAGPRRLAYPKRRVDFLGFDLFDRRARRFLPGDQVTRRLDRSGLPVVRARFDGRVDSVEALLRCVPRSDLGGAAEGVVVERADGQRAKVVRAAWARLPLRQPPSVTVRRASAPRDGGVVSKHFPAARARDAHVESAVLRALHGTRLAPRLLAHDVEADGAVTLTLSRLPGRPFPRNATPALAAALGDALAGLHARTRAVQRRTTVDVLPGDAARHQRDALRSGPGGATATNALPRESARGDSSRSTDAARALADLLAAQSAGAAPLALCHADLKPENLRVARGVVALLDFERACLADPAWELACAMDRLALDAPARQALLAAYAARRFDPRLAVRVQAFRLAWLPLLPRAVAALKRETGRRPSATARRLARASAARWRTLARSLVRWRGAP